MSSCGLLQTACPETLEISNALINGGIRVVSEDNSRLRKPKALSNYGTFDIP